MKYQESEGLLSSRIRNARLSRVAKYIREKSIVLDLACGAGYLISYLPQDCQYFGVDKIPMNGSQEKKYSFINLDLLETTAIETIARKVQTKVDYITCIAFLEHIKNPMELLSTYKLLLKRDGLIIGTTPHPRGRTVHEILARIGLLSKEAAHEHEKFLGKKQIEEIASLSGGELVEYHQFLYGMNQLFAIKYS